MKKNESLVQASEKVVVRISRFIALTDLCRYAYDLMNRCINFGILFLYDSYYMSLTWV